MLNCLVDGRHKNSARVVSSCSSVLSNIIFHVNMFLFFFTDSSLRVMSAVCASAPSQTQHNGHVALTPPTCRHRETSVTERSRFVFFSFATPENHNVCPHFRHFRRPLFLKDLFLTCKTEFVPAEHLLDERLSAERSHARYWGIHQ